MNENAYVNGFAMMTEIARESDFTRQGKNDGEVILLKKAKMLEQVKIHKKEKILYNSTKEKK